jgi:hypothetical protein
MKQCAVCSRTYADDTLEYCLDDGARLFIARDPEETRVLPDQRPTAPWPPQPLPPPDWSRQPAPVQPVPEAKSRSGLLIILALLVALGLIGAGAALLAYISSRPSATEIVGDTKPTPAPPARIKPTPDATPTPRATPKPTPEEEEETAPTPEPEPSQKPTPKPVSGGCVVSNDDAGQPDVNLRKDCHVKSCDDDRTTILGTLPNGTPVTVNRQVAPVRGRYFAWQQVTTRSGRTGWVAASKIRCQ